MIDALVRAAAEAVLDKAATALSGNGRLAEVLPAIATGTLVHARRLMPAEGIRMAARELASATDRELAAAVERVLPILIRERGSEPPASLASYLALLPGGFRRALRRPTDPTGKTLPERLRFVYDDAFLPMLPPRLPKLRPGPAPAGLEPWTLTQFLGFGPDSEVWAATDAQTPQSPTALKFVTNPTLAARILSSQESFLRAFDLNDEPGVVPLRAVHLDVDPPCLEMPQIPGYDLAGVMFDWRYRYENAKPEASLKLIRRLAEVIGRAHLKGVIHRDLKPSNVILHPTEGGKFTLWVTDFGLGEVIAAETRVESPGDRDWAASVGSHGLRYQSPEVARGVAPDPRDDVFAIGAIWYQLLRRDSAAPIPTEPKTWAEEFAAVGVPEEYVDLIDACLAHDPSRRPANAVALAQAVAAIPVPSASASMDGSRVLSLKAMTSATYRAPFADEPTGHLARVPVTAALSDPGRAILGAKRELPPTGHGGLPKRIKNSVGMEFVLVPPGKFKMGSPASEDGREENEGPVRLVTLTRSFYLATIPVTQAQFAAVTERNPAHFHKRRGGSPDYPVESLTWNDAVEFCELLAARTGESGRVYRLPTEAEWEYACRAGTSTPYSCGERLTPFDAHYLASAVLEGEQTGKTAPAGQFLANPFGLRDMHGNVGEWVLDWYDPATYRDTLATDPTGPDSGKKKVVRGGGWSVLGRQCRSAARRAQDPEVGSSSIGFRVLLEAPHGRGERGA